MRVARLVAAPLALVLALFPLAMERCRTACATPAPAAQTGEASSSAHACHEVASGGAEVIAVPLPRTCGHSDQAGVRGGLTLAASRTRIVHHLPAALLPADVTPVALEILALSSHGSSPPVDRVATPRNLPLRL